MLKFASLLMKLQTTSKRDYILVRNFCVHVPNKCVLTSNTAAQLSFTTESSEEMTDFNKELRNTENISENYWRSELD